MANKMKLKYFLLTLALIGLCVLTTAFPIKGKITINLTYGLLLLIAFVFGGWISGISGVFGICLFNLLKNNSLWLSLLGLVLSLTIGVMAWLTKKLLKKESFDKSAPMIAAGTLFLALGAIFTTARCCLTENYTVPRLEILMNFYWPLYVLPYILGVIFLVCAFIYKKFPENIQKPFVYSSMIVPASMVMYSIVAALCSLGKDLSFANSMVNAYNNYLMHFLTTVYVSVLAAIAIYLLALLFIAMRKKIRTMVE